MTTTTELPTQPRTTSRPSAPPWASCSRATVLVVDDNAIQRKLTTLRLKDEGLTVYSSAGAMEALSIARRVQPDAILSDVVMGDVDGFSFCRMVRRDSAVAHVPVILVSSHFQEHCDQQLATAVGADALVGRTPDMKQELAALHRVVRSHEAPNKASTSGPVLSAMYMRSVAGQLTRLAHGAQTTELKYRTFFENATDALSMIDEDGVLIEVNHRWETILQLPREQIVGHHIREFAAPDYLEANLATYHSVLTGHAPDTHLIAVARAGGGVVFMEMTSTPAELDGANVLFTIGRDVTDTLESRRKLVQSEQKYQSLVENIPDAVWSTTADGTLDFVSPNIVKLCGYTAEQVLARRRDDRNDGVHEADRTRFDAAFRALLKEGTAMDVVYRHRHADGSWRWLHARSTVVRDQERIVRTHGILSDVTVQRALEDQLHRAQKLEAIGQLTGGVAHDFNNLLAVILGNAGFLLDELQEEDARRSDAIDIRDAAQRAAVLTRQLLAFSRQQPIAPVVFDLNPVLENLQKMLRRVTSEDIELVVEAGAKVSRLRADPGQIEQVIMNLTVNARDAMPNGGTLLISTEEVEPQDDGAPHDLEQHAPRRPPGNYVCLSVRDTGCGMDEHVRQHIFEPFFTTKGPGKGTGLGLATCFGIVQHSGGFIDVESAPGVGTTMRVYLPVAQDEHIVGSANAAVPAAHGDETVLVIEDDDQVRRTVVRVLKARGYHVLAAGNSAGAQALAELHGTEVDLVLSDVVLADGNGFCVADRVREAAPGAKVLFMSGHVDHAKLEGRHLELSSTFIQKPFSADSLAQKVRSVLDAPAPSADGRVS